MYTKDGCRVKVHTTSQHQFGIRNPPGRDLYNRLEDVFGLDYLGSQRSELYGIKYSKACLG